MKELLSELKNKVKENRITTTIVASVFLVFIVLVIANLGHAEMITTVVKKIDKIERVKSDEGNITTTVCYLVFTESGTFEVRTSGMFAHPECLSSLQVGSEVTIGLRGYENSYDGVYRVITSVTQSNK